MKGRYADGRMTIYGHILPGALRIARLAERTGHLTERAKHKLKILDWHKSHGENISLTARHFGLTRKTLRSWLKRLKDFGPIGLNAKSRAPKQRRTPATPTDIINRVVKVRKEYPAWSKYKIQTILARDYGLKTSVSNVGRIMKRRGLIDRKKSAKRRKAALRLKLRFPRGLRISEAGDMIQMDTKYIILTGGRKLFQFTAIDVLSKKRVLRVFPSLSSRNGRLFLEECLRIFPFEIKAVCKRIMAASFKKSLPRDAGSLICLITTSIPEPPNKTRMWREAMAVMKMNFINWVMSIKTRQS